MIRLLVWFAVALAQLPALVFANGLIELGNSSGLMRPYDQSRPFEADASVVRAALLGVLRNRGAEIMVDARTTPVVSWAEPGLGFVMLSTQRHNPGHRVRNRSAPAWFGVVYGTARIVAAGAGCTMYVRTSGNRPPDHLTVYSDGTLEGNLLKDVAAAIPMAAAPARVTAPSRRPSASYADLFARRFDGLALTPGAKHRSTALARTYPVPLADAWRGTIDVLAQSDVLIRVDDTAMAAAIAQVTSVPLSRKPKATKPVSVVLEIHVRANGDAASRVAIGLRDPGTLDLRAIEDISKLPESVELAGIGETLEQRAAAVLADQLFGRIALQLLYRERWAGKFEGI